MSTEIKVTLVGDSACRETFIDSPMVTGWAIDGVLHAQLYSMVRNPPTSPTDPETASAHLRAHLALTVPAAAALRDTLAHHLAEMEKLGVIKPLAPQPAAPKH